MATPPSMEFKGGAAAGTRSSLTAGPGREPATAKPRSPNATSTPPKSNSPAPPPAPKADVRPGRPLTPASEIDHSRGRIRHLRQHLRRAALEDRLFCRHPTKGVSAIEAQSCGRRDGHHGRLRNLPANSGADQPRKVLR